MHWEKGDVHADEEQPEIPFSQTLAQHPSGDLREPEIESAEQRAHCSAQQHIVKMGDDEVGIVRLQIKRDRS